MMEEIIKCVICEKDVEQKKTPDGKVYWNQGENAEPYAEGRCCVLCNFIHVIPARLEMMGNGDNG